MVEAIVRAALDPTTPTGTFELADPEAVTVDEFVRHVGGEGVRIRHIQPWAARVTGARYAALGVLGENGTIARFITHGASEETIKAISPYPTGKGLLGLLIREPRVIHLDNLAEHPASAGFPPHHPPIKSFLGAPVRLGRRVYGNFYLTEKEAASTPRTSA